MWSQKSCSKSGIRLGGKCHERATCSRACRTIGSISRQTALSHALPEASHCRMASSNRSNPWVHKTFEFPTREAPRRLPNMWIHPLNSPVGSAVRTAFTPGWSAQRALHYSGSGPSQFAKRGTGTVANRMLIVRSSPGDGASPLFASCPHHASTSDTLSHVRPSLCATYPASRRQSP